MEFLRLRSRRRVGLVLSLVAASVLLAGCVAPPVTGPGGIPASTAPVVPVEEPSGDDGPSVEGSSDAGSSGSGSAKGTASVSMAGQQFEFELSFCSVTEEDVLVQGPGRDVDSGEVAYFAVDLVQFDGWLTGELRIDLGVDSEFASGDEVLQGLVGEDHEHVFMPQGADGFRLDVQLRATSTSTQLGPATVEVSCA